ncbi:glucose oxidase, partial [Stagonosporopsis vannaccii]
LLEQSGVGNLFILQEHGIDVVDDLLFVGENLLDQTTTDMFYTTNNSTNFTGLAGYAAYFNEDNVFGDDLAAFNASVTNSIKDYAEKTANASGTINQSMTEKMFRMQHDLILKNKILISKIIVSHSATGPITQIATAKMARNFANTTPFSEALSGEVTPGLDTVPDNASDAYWENWLNPTYRSNFHYIATAAMLPYELGGVVDSNLTVYGTGNVRVVDASVVPFQVCGHLTSTLYAIAEKAADMIKARYA